MPARGTPEAPSPVIEIEWGGWGPFFRGAQRAQARGRSDRTVARCVSCSCWLVGPSNQSLLTSGAGTTDAFKGRLKCDCARGGPMDSIENRHYRSGGVRASYFYFRGHSTPIRVSAPA